MGKEGAQIDTQGQNIDMYSEDEEPVINLFEFCARCRNIYNNSKSCYSLLWPMG